MDGGEGGRELRFRRQRSGFLRGRDPSPRTRPPGRSVASLFTHPEGREVGRSPAIPRTLVTVSNGQYGCNGQFPDYSRVAKNK